MWFVAVTFRMEELGVPIVTAIASILAIAIYGIRLSTRAQYGVAPTQKSRASTLRSVLLVLVFASPIILVGLVAMLMKTEALFSLPNFQLTTGPTGHLDLIFWTLLMPCAAAFWPLLRFVALPLDAQSRIRPVSRKLWFSAAGMFAVSSVSPPALGGSLAPLALPIAIWMAWQWKERATVPLIVGGIPFLFSIDLGLVQFPGGVWPLLAILFWSRFVRDAELRNSLLRRENLGWGELALIMLLLSHSAAFPAGKLLGHNVTFSVQPAWMLTTVALIIGASRMPRRRFAIAAVLTMVTFLVAGFYQTTLFPRLPFPHYEPRLGLDDGLALLIALFIAQFVRRAHSFDWAGFFGLQRRTVPAGDSEANARQDAASPRFATVSKVSTALDPGTFPFCCLAGLVFASLVSGLAPEAFLRDSSNSFMIYLFPTRDALALIAMAFGIVVALTTHRMAVWIGLAVLSLIWLVDTTSFGENLFRDVSWQLATLPGGTGFGVGLTGFSAAIYAVVRSWASIIVVGGFGLFGFALPYAIRQSPESFSPLQKLNARLTSIFVEAALNRSGSTASPARAADLRSRK